MPPLAGSPSYRRVTAALLLSAAAYMAVSVLWPEREARAATVVRTRLLGEAVGNLEPPLQLAREIAEQHEQTVVTLSVGNARIRKTRRALGLTVRRKELAQLLHATRDKRSALRTHLPAPTDGGERARKPAVMVNLPLPAHFDPKPALQLLLKLRGRVNRAARNASYDSDARNVRPSRAGRNLDVWGTLDQLADQLRQNGVLIKAQVKTRPARISSKRLGISSKRLGISSKQLGTQPFADKLATYDTRYDASFEAEDRTHNLRTVASKVDGTILLSGDTFDFNALVGERSEARGFRPAPVIAGGELADGVGGGACQVAGSLHAAAFYAGLPIVERYPHSRPSHYIRMGLDATVSYPKLNFRFTNNTPHPIAVVFKVQGGRATATLRGHADGRTVTFERYVREVLPFANKEREDKSLPSGIRVLAQRGIPGFRLERVRKVRGPNTPPLDESSEDVYPPTTEVWRVGTAGKAPDGYETPTGDQHPEYTADEYLQVVKRPGKPPTVWERTRGRTGKKGWTAEL